MAPATSSLPPPAIRAKAAASFRPNPPLWGFLHRAATREERGEGEGEGGEEGEEEPAAAAPGTCHHRNTEDAKHQELRRAVFFPSNTTSTPSSSRTSRRRECARSAKTSTLTRSTAGPCFPSVESPRPRLVSAPTVFPRRL
ncbi:unnamed protein product [Urochloa humidicola]